MTSDHYDGSIRELIRHAAQSGVRLWVENDHLHYDAPKGGMPEALRTALRARKNDVIGELSRPVYRKKTDPPAVLQYPAYWSDFWQETQANLWLRHATHIVLRVIGDISAEHIIATLDTLASRHDILRSSVRREDGVICLRLVRGRRVTAGLLDLTAEPPADPSRLRELIYRAIYDPLDGEGVYRATVLRISPQEHVVAIVCHHFVVDAFGCEILGGELAALLRGERLAAATAGERPLQYSEYLLGLNEWLAGQGFTYRLAFWREKMRAAPPVRLPPAQPAGLAPGKVESIAVPVAAPVRAALARAAANYRIPFQIVLLAAKFAALSHTLQSSDLVVTVLYWGRDDPALLELVGMTVNCVPVRLSVHPQMSYSDLLGEVSTTYHLARDYQVPWALLTDAFTDIGASSTAPLFNYMYVGEPAARSSEPTQATSRLETERVPVPVEEHLITVDWKAHEFTVLDDGRELLLTLNYIPARYDAVSAREFTNAFVRCLEAIGRDTTQSVAGGSAQPAL